MSLPTQGPPAARRLACGSFVIALGGGALSADLSAPSAAHRVVVACRGHQRVVWHGEHGVEVSHLSRETITVIPAGESGRLEITEDTGFHCVQLLPDRLALCAASTGYASTPRPARRIGHIDRRTVSLIELLFDCTRDPDPCSTWMAERAADLLCLQLIRHHSSACPAASTRQRGLAGWHIEKVARFVEPRLAATLSLDDLASQVGLSRYHFCTAFKQATGLTPSEWLTTKRINRAAAMLAQTELSVTDIAQSVGFGTSSSFAACFKRVMGTTPTCYRRQLPLAMP